MRLPRDLSGDSLAARLKRYGYEPTRQTGSHLRLTRNTEDGEHHVTPCHDPAARLDPRWDSERDTRRRGDPRRHRARAAGVRTLRSVDAPIRRWARVQYAAQVELEPRTAVRWAHVNGSERLAVEHVRIAVETGNVAEARSLLASGQDVNGDHGHDPQRFSLLHHAIDVEVDGFDQTGTPPKTEMIELLLSAGADPGELNYKGETPLDMAHGHSTLEAVIEKALSAR